jgi:hypothetical protein
MPHKSKRTEEREKWVTLPEAISHICIADNCEENKAQENLRFALADDVLLVRWEEEEPPEQQDLRKTYGFFNPSPWPPGRTSQLYSDRPPSGSEWDGAKINWQDGTVNNKWSGYKTNEFRAVLLAKVSIIKNWPEIARIPDSAIKSLPKRRAGAKPTQRQAILNFVKNQYPAGIPSHVKYEVICADFKQQTGTTISDRTLRRALGKR